jgi:Protein of unknown function (DUF2510)
MTMSDSGAHREPIPDPAPGTPAPGWYRIPGVADKAHYWDGHTLADHAEWIPRGVDLPDATPDMRTTDRRPPAPGWYRDPVVSGARRYWDGQGWVGDAEPLPARRPPVARWALIMMGVLTALGLVAVAAIFWLAPNCTAYQFSCTVEMLTSAAMWLVWACLLLLAIGANALYVNTAAGRREAGMVVMLLGVIFAYCAAAAFFPPLFAVWTGIGAAM